MEQSEIIEYFDEEILRQDSHFYTQLAKVDDHLCHALIDVEQVLNNIDNLSKIDLDNLVGVLALSNEEGEKLKGYIFFSTTSFYELQDKQKNTLKEQFVAYKEILGHDIENLVNLHPDLQESRKKIEILMECRGILLKEDFNLNDYVMITKKMKIYSGLTNKLIPFLSQYMNNLLIKHNHQK